MQWWHPVQVAAPEYWLRGGSPFVGHQPGSSNRSAVVRLTPFAGGSCARAVAATLKMRIDPKKTVRIAAPLQDKTTAGDHETLLQLHFVVTQRTDPSTLRALIRSHAVFYFPAVAHAVQSSPMISLPSSTVKMRSTAGSLTVSLAPDGQ